MTRTDETQQRQSGRVVFDDSLYRRPSRRPALFVALCVLLVLAVLAFSIAWQRMDSARFPEQYRYRGPLLPLQLLSERPDGLAAARDLNLDFSVGSGLVQVQDRYGLAAESRSTLRVAYPWMASFVEMGAIPEASLSGRRLEGHHLPGSQVALAATGTAGREAGLYPEDWRSYVAQLGADRPVLDRVAAARTLSAGSVDGALLPLGDEQQVYGYRFDYSEQGYTRSFQATLDPERSAVLIFGAEDVRVTAAQQRLTISTKRRGIGNVRIYVIGRNAQNVRLTETNAEGETRVRNSRLRQEQLPLAQWRLPLNALLDEAQKREVDRLLALTEREEASRSAEADAQQTQSTTSAAIPEGEVSYGSVRATQTTTETEGQATVADRLIQDAEQTSRWLEVLADSTLQRDEDWVAMVSRRMLHEAVLAWLQHHATPLEATVTPTTPGSTTREDEGTPSEGGETTTAGSATGDDSAATSTPQATASAATAQGQRTTAEHTLGADRRERAASPAQPLSQLPDSLHGHELLDAVLLNPRLHYLCFQLTLPAGQAASQLDVSFRMPLSESVTADRRRQQRAVWQRQEREAEAAGLTRRYDRVDFVPVAGSSLALTGFTGQVLLPPDMVVDENNLRIPVGSASQRFTVPGGPESCRIDLLSQRPRGAETSTTSPGR